MSFGRKGLAEAPRLTPGQAMALRAMPAPEPQARPQAEAISPALAAFLAAERAERGAEPGLSDVAQGIAHPAARPTSPGGGLSLAKAPMFAAEPTIPAPRQVTIVHRAERTLLLAYVLWFFTGGFSGHRHYLGRHGSALAQTGIYWAGMIMAMTAMFGMNAGLLGVGIVIAGGAGWWIIIDAFLIPGMVRKYNAQPSATAFA